MSSFNCNKCGKPMTLSHEEHGKPQYRCKPCQDKFFEGFTPLTPSVISDAHMRRIHSSCLNPPMELAIHRLSTGYWLIRGHGINNWAQTPYWPADEDTIRRCAFDEASEEFLREAIRRSNSWTTPNIGSDE